MSNTHIWFRGESKEIESLVKAMQYLWFAGMGETDKDPAYMFTDYQLALTIKVVVPGEDCRVLETIRDGERVGLWELTEDGARFLG